jgi:hypothetical protein
MTRINIGEACISSVCVKESGFMDYRFTAYKAAEELGFKVIRNPEDTGITQNKFSSILKQNSPVFILLVGDAKSAVVADECRLALERGLPVFVFLKIRHNDSGKPDKTEKPSDSEKPVYVDGEKCISVETQNIMKEISQITYNGDCALFASCEELYNAIRYRLNDYIEQKIGLSPIIQYNKGSTYYYAYEQILAAKKRIILSQKTSLLILGPRRGNTYERNTYDALFKWIENRDSGMQFMHLFCREETIEDTINEKEKNEYDIEAAKIRLCELLKTIREKNGGAEDPNFTFRSINKEAQSIAHLITDTGFQLVLPIAGDIFNVVIPYYFTPEGQLMKIITRIHTRTSVRYDEIEQLYKEMGS